MTFSNILNSSKKFYLETQDFIFIILKHNIFFHASSISYYAALSIAPFLLVLLQIGALLGNRLQSELINQTYFVLGPQVGKITEMIFSNANEGINLASISGIIGVAILLFTSSIVFIQLRFSLDTIYGYYDPEVSRSILEIIKERLFSMFIVVCTAILFFLSLFVSNIVKYIAGPDVDGAWGQIVSNALSFIINVTMFSGVYYFAPTRTPRLNSAVKMALFTSLAFILGNFLMRLYFKNVAMGSVYGATGTLLVFLVWAYYSSFIMFLSVEGYIFLHKEKDLPIIG